MHDPQLSGMMLEEVDCRCAEENIRYTSDKENDPNYCYELFYRALVKQDQDAWTRLYYQFESQVTYWVTSHERFAVTEQTADRLVNDAYSRMFRALKCLDGELFILRFPTLGAILAYLKKCAKSAVEDVAAKNGTLPETAVLKDEMIETDSSANDPVAVKEYRQELWAGINRHLQNELERIVFNDTYVLELKMPQIMAQHPELFTDDMQVYRIRARILRRLRKDPGLRRFLR